MSSFGVDVAAAPYEVGGAGRDLDLQPPFGPDHLLVQLRYVHVGAPRISFNLMSVVYIIYFTLLAEDPYNNIKNRIIMVSKSPLRCNQEYD